MIHLMMLKVERLNPILEYTIAKRVMDIVLSLIATILFSPIMVITAIAIKLEDHGPVFYKQTRLTKNSKRFEIYKFRSMRTDAEKDGVARLPTGDNDDRITKVGHFIRKVRIELYAIIGLNQSNPVFARVSSVMSTSAYRQIAAPKGAIMPI